MSKRKQPHDENAVPDTPSKRTRKLAQSGPDHSAVAISRQKNASPASKKSVKATSTSNGLVRDRSGSPTPKASNVNGFSTPRKTNKSAASTPSRSKNADKSAKRKSARILAEAVNEDDWDDEGALAAAILDDEAEDNGVLEGVEDSIEAGEGTPADTPSKRGRGRPKGSKNKRSPTPEGDIAPEERYFFQNRAGPPQYSTNLFSTVKLLTHDEYFEQIRSTEDGHYLEKAYLAKLHARSFPQWKFELDEGYSVCLYGYGSKRKLVTKFAEWLHTRSQQSPLTVIVNGSTPKLSIRHILNTIGSAIAGEGHTMKLTGQPQEMLDTLFGHLREDSGSRRLVVMVNSIDAPSLRKGTVQSVLSRLSAHPSVSLLATADTPTFPLLWSSALLDQYSFASHDCTTFARYESEICIVDEVYDLLGRKGRRLGGKEGIGYVLKSLPPNARKLYQILLAEILSILNEGVDVLIEDGVDGDEGRHSKTNQETAEDVGVEYRLLYQKATEDFVCSSDMNFRFLLKEFHDHQMITSRRDASGTELLCVPLGKDEMQAVLEDLVIA